MPETGDGLTLDETIDEILEAAEVAKENRDARIWLEILLEGLQRPEDSKETRIRARDHNKFFADIEKAVAKLRKAIKRLEKNRKAGSLFWHYPGLNLRDEPRDEVSTLLDDIDTAARTARLPSPTGRPVKAATRYAVERLYNFFVRFSELHPSSTEGGGFLTAAQYFYEYVFRTTAGNAELNRHVKAVLRKQRAEEERTKLAKKK